MDPRLITAFIVVVGVPAVLVGYILGVEWLLRFVPGRLQSRIRPWLWLAPALAFLFVAVFAFPYYWMAMTALKLPGELYSSPPRYLPSQLYLTNFVAVFTERHARTALEQAKLGRDLAPIYENLIDRLTMLASGHSSSQAEMRAIGVLARALKEWLP